MNKDGRILIGKVCGCFGVKGWLKVFSYSDPRENITTYDSWIIDGKLFESIQSKKNGKLIVVKLEGVDDKETAETFIGKKVEIDKQQLANLSDGQFYWRDLVGLEVSNTDGVVFGKVKNMLDTGANDVVIVKADEKGGRERLIPFINDQSDDRTIVKVDLEERTLLVDWHEDD